jgi:3-isopropylmalate dehydrogenase
MLCRYSLGCPEAAETIERAVTETLAAGHRTADLAPAGARAIGCREMGRRVRERCS